MEKTHPAAIRKLLDDTLMTGSQLARLMGVTERRVQHWMSGTPIAADQAERLKYIIAAVAQLDASTPEERHAALLDSSRGPSPFRLLLDNAPEGQRIQYPVPLSERFGAGPDLPAGDEAPFGGVIADVMDRLDRSVGSYSELWARPARRDVEALIGDALAHVRLINDEISISNGLAAILRDAGQDTADTGLSPLTAALTLPNTPGHILTEEEFQETFVRSLQFTSSIAGSEPHDDVGRMIKACAGLRDSLRFARQRTTALRSWLDRITD